MDVMLHKRCAKFIYVIPEGLRELMSDISREVIRSQPDHIYTFIADYLDALMITRENARVAARLVDSIIRIATMTVELLEQTGMTREEADRMANIIQDAFKKYMVSHQDQIAYTSRQEEEEEEQHLIINIIHQYGNLYDQETSAATIIQKAFREFKDRHAREKQLLTGMIDWRVAARSAIYLYRKTGVTMEEANRAATLIKAAYKGYYTRRIMRRLEEEGQHIYEERGEEIEERYDVSREDEEMLSDVYTEDAEGISMREREDITQYIREDILGGIQDFRQLVDGLEGEGGEWVGMGQEEKKYYKALAEEAYGEDTQPEIHDIMGDVHDEEGVPETPPPSEGTEHAPEDVSVEEKVMTEDENEATITTEVSAPTEEVAVTEEQQVPKSDVQQPAAPPTEGEANATEGAKKEDEGGPQTETTGENQTEGE